MGTRIQNFVYRLVSGKTYIKIDDKLITYFPPSVDLLHRADFFWEDLYNEGLALGYPDIDFSIELCIKQGWWSAILESELGSLPDKLETLKVDYFLAWQQKSEYSTKVLKKTIDGVRKKITIMNSKKYSLYNTTANAYADYCIRYWTYSQTLFDQSGFLVFNQQNREDMVFFNKVYNSIEDIPNDEYRTIARSSEWARYWNYKGDNFFGKNANELNEEQLQIWSVSKMFDSIYSSPNCPEAEVLDDSDLFDGWLIYINNKSESQIAKRELDKNLDKAGVKGGNIFVMAKNAEDVKKINNMNSAANKLAAQQFMGKLHEKAKK